MKSDRFTKRNMWIIAIVSVVVIAIIISVAILMLKKKDYTFKTEATDFTVTVPDGWEIYEYPRPETEPTEESVPSVGIRI